MSPTRREAIFYEVVIVKRPSLLSGCRDTSTDSPERAPRQERGSCRRRILRTAVKCTGRVLDPRRAHPSLVASLTSKRVAPTNLLSVSVRCRHRAPKTTLEAWKRVPPSRLRFSRGESMASSRERAPARAASRIDCAAGKLRRSVSAALPPAERRVRHTATRRRAVCARAPQCRSVAAVDYCQSGVDTSAIRRWSADAGATSTPAAPSPGVRGGCRRG